MTVEETKSEEQNEVKQEKDKVLNIKIVKDLHWTQNNIMTLLSWISISTFNIDCLELAIIRYRNWMRQHVILGLVLSTISGTLSVTQFGSFVNQRINFILNFFFTVFTFTVAISTGCIKVYQVQERLEKFITIKQEWIVFITKIATQFQLNIDLRKDALDLINSNKDKYLDLLKIDNEIPDFIKRQVKNKLMAKRAHRYYKDFHPSLEIGEAMSISDIIMNIGYVEGKNLCHLEKDKKEKKQDECLDLELNEYFEENYRNCISRSNSFCELPDQSKGKFKSKILNNLISLPSFLHKHEEKTEVMIDENQIV